MGFCRLRLSVGRPFRSEWMPREAGQWECPLVSLCCVQPPRRRLGFAESLEEVRKVFTALWQDSDQHHHHANHKTSGMNDHGVPTAGR